MKNPSHRRTTGFTLVECVISIALLAFLLAVAIPAAERDRQVANRVKCLQNLGRIGLAMQMYANENGGLYPSAGRRDQQYPEDLIYWQQPRSNWDPVLYTYAGRTREPDGGALVQYMGGHFDPAVWTCPSDPVDAHQDHPAYPYSYAMNFLLAARPFDPVALIFLDGKPVVRQGIRFPSTTVMVLEESPASINDGATALVGFNDIENPGDASTASPGGNGQGTDWLSVEHDPAARHPDDTLGAGDTGGIPDTQARGNVVFCDGHADWVTREYVQTPSFRHWDPTFQGK